MLTVFSENHSLHQPWSELHGGVMIPPFETPRRVEIILDRINHEHLGPVIEPKLYGLAPVLAVHDPDYLIFLETCWPDWKHQGNEGDAIPSIWPTRRMNADTIPDHIEGKLGYYALSAESAICEGTYAAATASKDVALTTTEHVLTGSHAAFGLCRPPGHHAAFDQYGGYCFLNNAAIAAQYALDAGKTRAAILDVDFHHGNGTQDIFYTRDDVLTVSIHGDPLHAFPYFLGHANETGKLSGDGFNVNLPLAEGSSYDVWLTALENGLEQINHYQPDLLVVSLGVDTFEDDPISFFRLRNDDFFDYGRHIAKLGLPTVFLMEGGYAVDDIGINVVNVLAGFES